MCEGWEETCSRVSVGVWALWCSSPVFQGQTSNLASGVLSSSSESAPKSLSGFETMASPMQLHSPLLKKLEKNFRHIRRFWQFNVDQSLQNDVWWAVALSVLELWYCNGEDTWTVPVVIAQQSCGCTAGLLAWGICAQTPVEFPGDPSLLKGNTDVAQFCFLAARGTPKVLVTASSFLKVLQHSILLPRGPPGQGVHQFWCEKLAGETDPGGPTSWACSANPVVPSECFQYGSVTSTSIGLCPFQRKGGMYVLLSCGESHVCPSWTGRRRGEVTCESWWFHPCCCSTQWCSSTGTKLNWASCLHYPRLEVCLDATLQQERSCRQLLDVCHKVVR